MLGYYLRLAAKSFRRTPGVTALMVGAIGLGIGICVTALTLYHMVARNPIEHRNDVLYAVTMDTWDPTRAWDNDRPELAPTELTHRDAVALLAADGPSRRVVMRKGSFVVEGGPESKPFLTVGRLTTGDFFAMFDAPFLYGSGWDAAADRSASPVVVLSRKANEQAFGGEDSVGRSIRLDGRDYRIVGVLDHWRPSVKFFDLTNGSTNDMEDVYLPFALGAVLEVASAGNINCWKPESINSFKDLTNSECIWLQAWVELLDGAARDRFQGWMDAYAAEQKKLGRFQRPINNRLYRPGEWLEVNRVVGNDNRVLVGLAFAFLAVCVLNLVGLLLAKFLGGAPVIALRRALGASRAEIFRQHLVEVGAIGLVGGTLGIVVAWLGMWSLRGNDGTARVLEAFDFQMVAIATAIALVAGLVAGLYPAWRVGRVAPASYLKGQ